MRIKRVLPKTASDVCFERRPVRPGRRRVCVGLGAVDVGVRRVGDPAYKTTADSDGLFDLAQQGFAQGHGLVVFGVFREVAEQQWLFAGDPA